MTEESRFDSQQRYKTFSIASTMALLQGKMWPVIEPTLMFIYWAVKIK
jgi:hypothetical protein